MMRRKEPNGRQRGFSLVELLIATVVLLVGVAAVVQLVPEAIRSNLNNRMDTTAVVVVQRLRDLIVQQGVAANQLVDPQGLFPCSTTSVCELGLPQDGVVNGSTLLANGQIDFNAGPVARYNFTWRDPNDPSRTVYEVRWAVIATVRPMGDPPQNTLLGKRYIIGARARTPRGPLAVTMHSWVSR